MRQRRSLLDSRRAGSTAIRAAPTGLRTLRRINRACRRRGRLNRRLGDPSGPAAPGRAERSRRSAEHRGAPPGCRMPPLRPVAAHRHGRGAVRHRPPDRAGARNLVADRTRDPGGRAERGSLETADLRPRARPARVQGTDLRSGEPDTATPGSADRTLCVAPRRMAESWHDPSMYLRVACRARTAAVVGPSARTSRGGRGGRVRSRPSRRAGLPPLNPRGGGAIASPSGRTIGPSPPNGGEGPRSAGHRGRERARIRLGCRPGTTVIRSGGRVPSDLVASTEKGAGTIEQFATFGPTGEPRTLAGTSPPPFGAESARMLRPTI